MQDHLTPESLARDLAVRDLTDPAEGPHAMQLLVGQAVTALTSTWPAAVRLHRGPRIVSVEDNYDRLGIAADAVTRDRRYTRYVNDTRLLRSHSTALVPAALRALADDPLEDVLLVCPGVVYRRDSIDRIHAATPHQLDLWRIARTRLGVPDLDEMNAALLAALSRGRRARTIARAHPYTECGRQVDVDAGGEWVEVWECGLAHPAVLAGCGLDPSEWSGLALGMGLDRLLMLRKDIPDIRLLRSADPRVAAQMVDLTPYRPVSSMPALRRDLSIAVGEDVTEEDLGDRVREILGAGADVVEELRVLKATPCAALPEQARERLGIRPGQHNLLVRVVLRALDRTLTDAEANELRNSLYAVLHEGAAVQWARS